MAGLMFFRVHVFDQVKGQHFIATIQAPSKADAIQHAESNGLTVRKVEEVPSGASAVGTENCDPSSSDKFRRSRRPNAKVIVFVGILIVAVVALWTNIGRVLDHPLAKSETKSSIAPNTKSAWDEMVQVDLRYVLLRNSDPEKWTRQLIAGYGRIDTDYADDDLRIYIRDYMRLIREYSEAIRSYKGELSSVSNEIDSAAELGRLLGSMDKENPQGGGNAGYITGGALGYFGTQGRLQEIQRKYMVLFNALEKDEQELSNRRSALHQGLADRYHLPFNEKL